MYVTNEIMQAAYVVEDMDAAIDGWRKTTPIGPFFVIRNASPENFQYRGKPAKLVMDLAFAQAGPIQIELIQPKSAGPNVFSDSAPIKGQFYHHQCYITDDLDAEFARFAAMGIAVAQQADTGGVRFAYFDTRHLIGCMTEVIQRGDAYEAMCTMIADAAVDWDGSDPVRMMG